MSSERGTEHDLVFSAAGSLKNVDASLREKICKSWCEGVVLAVGVGVFGRKLVYLRKTLSK